MYISVNDTLNIEIMSRDFNELSELYTEQIYTNSVILYRVGTYVRKICQYFPSSLHFIPRTLSLYINNHITINLYKNENLINILFCHRFTKCTEM